MGAGNPRDGAFGAWFRGPYGSLLSPTRAPK